MSAGAVVATGTHTPTPTPKRHGFSIESLIGRRDDSPVRRQSSLGVVGAPTRGTEVEDSHRPRSRGATSPTSTDDERTTTGRGPPSPPCPTSPVTSPRLEKSSASSSPETENRFGPWSSDDFKQVLGSGAFHHAAHSGGPGVPGLEGSNLYPPLRVCNRSLSAAMNSAALMPQHFAAAGLNPLFYSLQREMVHHPSPHHLLAAARYPGFMHHRYPREYCTKQPKTICSPFTNIHVLTRYKTRHHAAWCHTYTDPP
ncbi:hypothetical protein BaRGS_00012449 [Batillaria attramentaria]|uniref:Uncharacterized protein n=1 Tax=Batillaria attramentaria TaxID=370345 RepID=A0ABD0LAX9_9CAEN